MHRWKEWKTNPRNAGDSSVDMKSDTLPIPRTNAKKNLPEGWEITQLKDICERITKGSTPTSYGYSYTTNGIRFIKAENIDRNGSVSTTTDYIDEETNEYLKRSILRENDILFSIAGTIGRVGLIHEKDLPANTNQALAIIRFHHSAVDTKYLFYYLKSDAIQREAIKRIVGVGRANLSLTEVGELEIALAPPSLQKLIVSEIEKQFSRLDEAVAALKRVRASLKRYKASVLKAAVEGKLTEGWRKQQKGKSRENADLPEDWQYKTISDIGEVVTGTTPSKSKKEYYESRDYPFFKPTDLNAGFYVRESADWLSKKGIEKARLLPPKSILVTCIGATIGKTGLTRVTGTSNQQINTIIPKENILPEFIYFSCIAPQFQKSIIDNASATTLPILNKRKFELLTLFIPSRSEQQKIVEEIESRLSVAEEVEEAIDINLKRAERLRQAILKKAFEGRLCPTSC